jgi:hypothetical protein
VKGAISSDFHFSSLLLLVSKAWALENGVFNPPSVDLSLRNVIGEAIDEYRLIHNGRDPLVVIGHLVADG